MESVDMSGLSVYGKEMYSVSFTYPLPLDCIRKARNAGSAEAWHWRQRRNTTPDTNAHVTKSVVTSAMECQPYQSFHLRGRR